MQYDDAVNFVVVRGSGEKAFCAGGDIRGENGHCTRETVLIFL